MSDEPKQIHVAIDSLFDELESGTSDTPTLHEIARKTRWCEGFPLPSAQMVTELLKSAGVNAADENERERFLNLVKVEAHFKEAEEIARLGPYYDQAIAEGCDEEEAVHRMYELDEEEESNY
jgi:hypothetical protein